MVMACLNKIIVINLPLTNYWQFKCNLTIVPLKTEVKSLIYGGLSKLFKHNFIVDFYSQGGICFADRDNQILVNYDGNIFKCTTICNFGEENTLGYLDTNTGLINWNKKRIEYLYHDSIAEICQNCRMLPSCGGFCKKKIAAKEDSTCFLTASNFGSITNRVGNPSLAPPLRNRPYT